MAMSIKQMLYVIIETNGNNFLSHEHRRACNLLQSLSLCPSISPRTFPQTNTQTHEHAHTFCVQAQNSFIALVL